MEEVNDTHRCFEKINWDWIASSLVHAVRLLGSTFTFDALFIENAVECIFAGFEFNCRMKTSKFSVYRQTKGNILHEIAHKFHCSADSPDPGDLQDKPIDLAEVDFPMFDIGVILPLLKSK